MKNKSPLKCRMPIPPSCRLTASNGIRLTGKRKSYEAAMNRVKKHPEALLQIYFIIPPGPMTSLIRYPFQIVG